MNNKRKMKKKKRRDKESQYVLVKNTIHQEDLTIGNINAPNIGAPSFIKQMLLDIKGQIGPHTIIVGDFNSPISPMDR
jgi:hypothetical protein